jgi:PAS domain S-box-containing protein
MENTFMTLLDLTDDANILYVSDTVTDVLGYTQRELLGQPAWGVFHSNHLDHGKRIHRQALEHDKASMLVYCDLKHASGQTVQCEVCFSVCFDAIVAAVSPYKDNDQSRCR